MGSGIGLVLQLFILSLFSLRVIISSQFWPLVNPPSNNKNLYSTTYLLTVVIKDVICITRRQLKIELCQFSIYFLVTKYWQYISCDQFLISLWGVYIWWILCDILWLVKCLGADFCLFYNSNNMWLVSSIEIDGKSVIDFFCWFLFRILICLVNCRSILIVQLINNIKSSLQPNEHLSP